MLGMIGGDLLYYSKTLREQTYLLTSKIIKGPKKEEQRIQWPPIQMRAFHSNENGLFCTHTLLLRSSWWKERGSQAGSFHLNEKFLLANRTL